MDLDDSASSPGCSSTPRSAQRALPRTQLVSGFRVISLLTLLSRFFGLARDMAMAGVFGAGPIMDAFTVAFRVPNLVRRLFGEGALTAAFLPVFVREHEREGPAGANRLMTAGSYALGGVLLLLVMLVEVVFLLMWFWVPMGEEGRLLLLLTAQLLPYTILICLVAQWSAVLQSLGRFAWPAFAPVLVNIVWLVALVMISVATDDPWKQIQAVALSIVAAGVLELLLLGGVIYAAGMRYSPQWRQAMGNVTEVMRAMIPVTLLTSVTQVNALLDSLMAWGLAGPANETMILGIGWPLEPGTASALYFAQRMYQFPLGVFGVALGTVLFPLLSRHSERGELELMGRDLTMGMRLTIAVGIPASVGLILLREPIAATFFQRGAFTSENAALTARCIAAYGSAVWAYVGLLIIHRAFYALGDRTTPMRIGFWAVGFNLLLNVTLIWVFAGVGLALATSIAAIGQFVWTAAAYQRRTGLLDLSSIRRATGRTVVATIVMGAACLGTLAWLPRSDSLTDRLTALFLPCAAGLATFLATARLIGLEEPLQLLRTERIKGED